MSEPTISNPIGTGSTVIPRDPFENETIVQRDEHIARLTQDIKDLRAELNRVKDLTDLSITLQSPLPKPRNTAPNPRRFSSLDSPVLEHFLLNILHLPPTIYL
ncbi:hypothetical protein BC332_03340 [Capsicum chinense]|nr:hypothetical protein BC332_03340 [Capsicum chinense]